MVRSKKGGQKHSGVGLGHEVNKIGASDEGADGLHLLLTQRHFVRNMQRLQSLKSSVITQTSRKERGGSTAAVAFTSCMLMPSSISSASASDASPKPGACDASQSLISEAAPAVENTSDTVCKGNATSGSSSSLHEMAMHLAAVALLAQQAHVLLNADAGCQQQNHAAIDACRCRRCRACAVKSTPSRTGTRYRRS